MSNERDAVFGGPEAEIDVLLEPTNGHTTADVVQRLRKEGASAVTVLSAGFISARVTGHVLESLNSVATAHPKATKQMRRWR